MAKRKKAVWKRNIGQERTWFVREWLIFKNKRQKDLVNSTEWNKSQISEWVNEEERWNGEVLYAFAHAIGVEPADLLRPPPQSEAEDEFSRFVVHLDWEQKQRLLRLWRAVEGDGVKAA